MVVNWDIPYIMNKAGLSIESLPWLIFITDKGWEGDTFYDGGLEILAMGEDAPESIFIKTNIFVFFVLYPFCLSSSYAWKKLNNRNILAGYKELVVKDAFMTESMMN